MRENGPKGTSASWIPSEIALLGPVVCRQNELEHAFIWKEACSSGTVALHWEQPFAVAGWDEGLYYARELLKEYMSEEQGKLAGYVHV